MATIKTFSTSLIYTFTTAIASMAIIALNKTHLFNALFLFMWFIFAPLCLVHTYFIKKNKYNGVITSKQTMLESISFVLVTIVMLLVFEILFFEMYFKNFKINYIQQQGNKLLQALNDSEKIKVLQNQINTAILNVTLFKECAILILKYFILGLISSVFSATLFKNSKLTI